LAKKNSSPDYYANVSKGWAKGIFLKGFFWNIFTNPNKTILKN